AFWPGNISPRLSGADPFTLDFRVLVFTAGAGVITVMLFGLAPAAGALRFDVMSRLRDAARGSSRERQRSSQILVVVEIALALMLLAGAGLTMKSLARLHRQ